MITLSESEAPPTWLNRSQPEPHNQYQGYIFTDGVMNEEKRMEGPT